MVTTVVRSIRLQNATITVATTVYDILFCAKRMSVSMSCKARCLFSKACTICDMLQGYITLSLRNGGHLTENCSLNLNTMK